MRCKNCNYLIYNYSENYEECFFGFEDNENGCKYRQKTLDKFSKEIEDMEAEEYSRMAEYFSKMEKTNEQEKL